jgi:hypothetical protein
MFEMPLESGCQRWIDFDRTSRKYVFDKKILNLYFDYAATDPVRLGPGPHQDKLVAELGLVF